MVQKWSTSKHVLLVFVQSYLCHFPFLNGKSRLLRPAGMMSSFFSCRCRTYLLVSLCGVCSYLYFWPRHRQHEATSQSDFVFASSSLSDWHVWALTVWNSGCRLSTQSTSGRYQHTPQNTLKVFAVFMCLWSDLHSFSENWDKFKPSAFSPSHTWPNALWSGCAFWIYSFRELYKLSKAALVQPASEMSGWRAFQTPFDDLTSTRSMLKLLPAYLLVTYLCV